VRQSKDSFFCSRRVKARKAHACVESPACKRGIKAGDLYEKHTGVWEGEFFAVKVCVRCVRLHEKSREESDYPDEAAPYGELLVWWQNTRCCRK